LFVQRAQAALQAVNALDGEVVGDMGCPLSQSPVLRIIVDHLVYPVTLEVLYQVRTSRVTHHFVSCVNRMPTSQIQPIWRPRASQLG